METTKIARDTMGWHAVTRDGRFVGLVVFVAIVRGRRRTRGAYFSWSALWAP